MDLPQEIVDEVIDNLAFDFKTLRSTSLVRKSWTHRSRLRLFHFIPFNSLDQLERWSLSISSDPNGIASYPRVILLSLDGPKSWVEPVYLDEFCDHFRSFSAVERLAISGLETTKFDAISTPRYFGNFAATVRSLELRIAIGPPAALLSFICAFPLVDDLALEFPTSGGAGGENQGQVARLSGATPSFGGKLRLLDMINESYPLVELLCTLPLSFHTIRVSSGHWGRLPQLAKLTSKCGKTLRSLHITKKTHGAAVAPTGASLASCVALEELRITAKHPRHLVTILGEILPTLANTTNLTRIVLDADGSSSNEGVDKATWNSLDAVMSEYAEKISGKHRNRRLTLVFRTNHNNEGPAGGHNRWDRELVRLLVFFPKVGNVEYISTN